MPVVKLLSISASLQRRYNQLRSADLIFSHTSLFIWQNVRRREAFLKLIQLIFLGICFHSVACRWMVSITPRNVCILWLFADRFLFSFNIFGSFALVFSPFSSLLLTSSPFPPSYLFLSSSSFLRSSHRIWLYFCICRSDFFFFFSFV